jgi:phage shock protein C
MAEGSATPIERLESMLREGRISPDEYTRLRDALMPRATTTRSAPDNRGLRKSWSDRQLGGVCGGIADYYGVSATRIRLLFLLFILVSGGTALLVYLALYAVLPWDETEREQVLAARHRWIVVVLVLVYLVPFLYFLMRYFVVIAF